MARFIGRVETRKETPMTADATPAHAASSLFVFYDDKPAISRMTNVVGIPQVLEQGKVVKPRKGKVN
jgi:hypothetical protein